MSRGVLRFNDKEYSELLREIDDPPEKLYYKGKKELLKKTAIGVVGSRKATAYGLWAAKQIGKILARNDVVVVSGLAYGIDKMAHIGALEEGGETIAVMAGGLDECYPKSHRELFDEIGEKGLLISEYKNDIKYLPFHFPKRNRIISGISLATVVVEAGNSSGSLITAEYAARQGRTVFAVPGNINSKMSLGTNKLIRDGATPLVIFEQIMRDLNIPIIQDEHKINKNLLGKDEKKIYAILKENTELSVNQLCLITEMPPGKVKGIITVLEMKGIVENEFGKVFIAN